MQVESEEISTHVVEAVQPESSCASSAALEPDGRAAITAAFTSAACASAEAADDPAKSAAMTATRGDLEGVKLGALLLLGESLGFSEVGVGSALG